MLKGELIIIVSNSEIIGKTISKFGNGAHIFISKKYIGKEVKIIFGKSKIIGNKIIVDFFNAEIIQKKITKFGTGAHVIIPKEYSNKEVNVIIGK